MNINFNTTVSVCVITYNSGKYILETLESIKNQTYKNFELIISDDCSSDNTVDICKKWLSNNKQCFQNIKLIEATKNTGVAPNCNRAYNAASGEWIKCIAGDDLLLPDSIETYLHYTHENPSCRICYGMPIMFGSNAEAIEKMKQCFDNEFHKYIKEDLRHQKKEIIKRLFVPGPGLFVQKRLWDEVGGFDEKYPFGEEYPFTFRVIEANNKIWWIGKPTIKYRLTENSLSHNDNHKISYIHFQSNYDFFLNTRRYQLIKRGYLFTALHQSIRYYVDNLDYINSPKYKYAKLLLLLSPIWYINKIQYMTHKN